MSDATLSQLPVIVIVPAGVALSAIALIVLVIRRSRRR